MNRLIKFLIYYILFLSANSNAAISPSVCVTISPEEAPVKLWETTGFSAPESVVYDAKTKQFYVSNLQGGGTLKDGDGWISRLDKNGKILQLKWATGKNAIAKDLAAAFNAPKGMRIRNNQLWVTDIDQVLALQLTTGKVSNRIKIPGALFLNDIVFSKVSSAIYVSDMFTNKIHILKKSPAHSVFFEGEKLESPNGLVGSNDGLLVAAWGPGLKKDFSTKKMGKILIINEKNKTIKDWAEPRIGNLDGIELMDAKTVIVSDWVAGKIFKVEQNGTCTMLLSGFKGSADLTYLREDKILVVPLMLENKVVAYKL